ncbi:MAG: uroporphyrinogen decarboxylase family protein, partial [Fimbriimonadaceae bacterium]
HLFPALTSLIAILRDAGKRVIFHSEGNYEAFLPNLADAGVHGFVIGSSMDLSEALAEFGGSCMLIGNADDRTLFNGSEAEIRLTIQRCIRSGFGHNGYVFSFGHELATNTPVASLEFAQMQFETLTGRAAA